VYNGTFVIGIRPSSAYAEIIFAADSILEQAAEQRVLTDVRRATRPGEGTGATAWAHALGSRVRGTGADVGEDFRGAGHGAVAAADYTSAIRPVHPVSQTRGLLRHRG
jgi:hypothetical protein